MKKLSIVVLFLAAFFVGFIGYAQGYKVGDKAADFKLKNIDGNMVSMADQSDAKGFIVIFTCNHCPFAIKYEDRIIDINNRFGAKGFPVIAINPNDPIKQPEDSYENMKIRAQEKGFNFPYVFDETQEVAKKYGATKTPHVYLLVREKGNLVVKYIGAIDDNSNDAKSVKDKFLENALEEVIAGKKVSTNTTKAIGCSIKWKAA